MRILLSHIIDDNDDDDEVDDDDDYYYYYYDCDLPTIRWSQSCPKAEFLWPACI